MTFELNYYITFINQTFGAVESDLADLTIESENFTPSNKIG